MPLFLDLFGLPLSSLLRRRVGLRGRFRSAGLFAATILAASEAWSQLAPPSDAPPEAPNSAREPAPREGDPSFEPSAEEPAETNPETPDLDAPPTPTVAPETSPENETGETSSTENSENEGASPAIEDSPEQLSLFLVLVDTPLSREAVLDALEKEFGIPIVDATEGRGLVVRVEGKTLTVSFIDADGQVVRRTMDLPNDEARQLDTIALLSGNLARDEAGALLAELRANQPRPQEATPSEEPPPPAVVPTPAPPAAAEPKGLPEVWFSASLTGDMTSPRDLEERRTHFELGLVYSRIGALDGAALTFLASSNRGLDLRPSRGAQMSLLWTQKKGPMSGTMLSLASHSEGYLEGLQLTALLGTQIGDLSGAQLSGLSTFAQGTVSGAQLAGLGVIDVGDVDGVQMGGIGALTTGKLDGLQMGTLFAVTGGDVRGAQLSALSSYARDLRGVQLAPLTIARTLHGFQLGIVDVAHGNLAGLQIGVVNVGGALRGTQVGLLNISGKGRGTQVGLLNIAARNEGTSVGVIDIVPGVRTQLFAYAGYTPSEESPGIPHGPLGHVGVKFLSDPVYTYLSFGAGPEGEGACSPETPEEKCGGNQAYSVAWGLGLRARLYGPLFSEFDLGYQFEKAFDQSRNARHSIPLRAALVVEFNRWVALFAGAGPRFDFYEGSAIEDPPQFKVGPNFFAGVEFF